MIGGWGKNFDVVDLTAGRLADPATVLRSE